MIPFRSNHVFFGHAFVSNRIFFFKNQFTFNTILYYFYVYNIEIGQSYTLQKM